MKTSDILQRIDELLQLPAGMGPLEARNAAEISQGCVSLLTLVYGPKSSHVTHYNTTIAGIEATSRDYWIMQASHGVLRNLKREIEQGLVGSLKQQAAGELLTDFVQLSRSVLDEKGEGAKNVAAVLAAAAYEDTIRRMGETFVGVIRQNDLSDVLKRLKEAGAIQSPQIGIAQSYLNFRNHALHANWDNIERESIHSVLGFVEQLLLKHFV